MYEFITIGGGSYFVEIFNGIASLLKSADYMDAFKITSVVAFMWIMLNAAFNNSLESVAKWFVTVFLITQILINSKATLHITDKTNPTLQGATVDNVPLVIAFVASTSSQIGYLLTKQFEAVYSLPDDIKYQNNGMTFGSKMIETMSNATIYNTKFSESMDSFIRNCIFYDLMLDNYSFDDLKTAPDIWALITPLQSETRFFTYVSSDKTKPTEYPSCKDGVVKLEADWAKELGEWANPLSTKINFFTSALSFGKNETALKQQVINAIAGSGDVVTDYLMGVSMDGFKILKQSMTNNAIIVATENYEAEFSQQQYQNTRASLQSKSTYQTFGAQASQWLPIFKIAVEALFYGLFPIIVLLCLIPNMTITVLKGYFFTFFWLASWGPIYAILNLLITGYASNKMSNGLGFYLLNQQNIQTITSDISAAAGYFAMMVPFIAAGLAKGGVAAMSSVSTSFLAVAQGAATQAANEGVTGNLDFGRVNLNSRHAYSGVTMQNDAGMLTNYHKDGSSSIAMGTAESNTGYNIHASDRLENIASQSIAHEKSLAESKGLQSQQLEARGFESILQNHRNIESSKDFGEQLTSDQKMAFQRSNSAIEDFAKSHDISRSKSAEIFGGIGAGLPFGVRGSLSSSDQETYQEAQKYSEQHQLSEDFQIIKSAIQTNRLNFNDSQGQSINDNFSKSTQLSQEQSIHLENAERFTKQKQYIESNSASIDKTYNQEFYNYIRTDLANGNANKTADLFNPNDASRHEVLDRSAAKFLEDKFHNTNINESFDQDYKYQATKFLNQHSPKNLMSNEAPPQFDDKFQQINNSKLYESTQNQHQETRDTINNMKTGNIMMAGEIYGDIKNAQEGGVLNSPTKRDIEDIYKKKDN